jgi:hypothetical protein
MEKELYSIYKIITSDLEYSNYCSGVRSPRYIKNLIKFDNQDYRVIIISYNVWTYIYTELELYVLPEQNLIVLNLLAEDESKNICAWLCDTISRGFNTRPDSYLLKLMYDTNSITKNYKQQLIQLTNSTEIRNTNITISKQSEYVF